MKCGIHRDHTKGHQLRVIDIEIINTGTLIVTYHRHAFGWGMITNLL